MQWTTVSHWVDLETGEALTKEEALQNFVVTGKNKFTTFKTNKHGIKTSGIVEIINRCRRKPRQLKTF